MSGNSFGKIFRLTSAGESHGQALIGIVDGVPPNLDLSEEDFVNDMARRRPGNNNLTSPRRELDQVEILSGVFNGKTTGMPVTLLIKNIDVRSQDYSQIATTYRPGHADYTYDQKYGIRDYRGGGRSSARETAIRVAAGVIAKKILRQTYNIEVFACVSQVGMIGYQGNWYELESKDITSKLFAPSLDLEQEYEEYLRQIKKEQDSIGAKVTVIAKNVPCGLGEPVFDRLDAKLAYALMGINAVKAVEIGDGTDVVKQKGSYHRDQILGKDKFASNNAGGILGGISSGQDIICHLSLKPTSSISIPIKTVDNEFKVCDLSVGGRHDPCVGIRAVPIAEAMVAITLVDSLMLDYAQCHLLSKD